MSGWMDVIIFSNYYSYSFSLILTKLGTRVPCTNMHETVEHIFKILLLKSLAIFEIFF